MDTYKIGQRVETIVEQIMPFGIFVRLPDGSEGYIRRRELALDADVEPADVVKVGDNLEAVILNFAESGKKTELSHRAVLQDPWPAFVKNHQVGDILSGEIRALHPNGVFIRVQPGINGFAPLSELVPKPIEKPEEVLWIGDKVEAVISSISSQKKHLGLSIKARMIQYDQALTIARDLTAEPSKDRESDQALHPSKTDSGINEEIDFALSGPILIVEDDEHLRSSLKDWFMQKGIQVSVARSIQQAQAALQIPYKILLVDLHLQEEDGLRLAREIKTKGRQEILCVMSSPDILVDRADEIQDISVLEAFAKPLDMDLIENFLTAVVQGKPLHPWQAGNQNSNSFKVAGTFGSLALGLDTPIHAVLKEIAEMVQAKTSILFQLDPGSKTVSIQALTGDEWLNHEAIYGLRDSPVKDVILGGESMFETNVTSRAEAKYDKLLNLLPFESCIGIPVNVLNEGNRALFLFHPDENVFYKHHLRNAQSGALFLSAILTDLHVRDLLLSLNPMIISGELAAGFGHDVFNKITALELEARNLVDFGPSDLSSSQRILDLVMDLKGTVQAFQELLKRKEFEETISINTLLEQAVRLILPVARKEKTTILSNLAPDLPPVTGNAVFLQQAFLNIMLNAIQQMVLKAEKFRWEGKRTLEISSSCRDSWLAIRFKDNGPGVHKEHLERLFTPGFTTRGGSGLGLFIAQNFIRALEGSLRVEETFIPLGTTFLVELPLEKSEDEQ